MELKQVFNQSFGAGTIAFVLSQLINGETPTAEKTSHHNSGQRALVAAAAQLEPHASQGGVVHYQRDLGQVEESAFFSAVVLDLFWIQRYMGKIARLKSYYKGQESSRQLFLTLRLGNQVIVQYGLNSLADLTPSFSFDFSSRGYNLDFDDQIQAPIRLNSAVVQESDYQLSLTAAELAELKDVWEILALSLTGGA